MHEPAVPRILDSARKHHVEDTDILHALRNPVRLYDMGDGLTMWIGPSMSARVIEVGVVDGEDGPVIVHAMSPRPQFLPKG